MTTDCNFKCQYCYEDYHNHYQLNEKTLVDSLEFMMNYGDRGKVLIDFLGGEPLLKKELIYQAVAYIKDNYPEREVKYYITTNCSLMDDRFIAFMKENRFTVRLSFDGNKETHDLNRVAKDEVSVIITKTPCVLLSKKKKPLYVAHADKCKKCGMCMKPGCPAMTKNEDGTVHIDDTMCTGCGLCDSLCKFGAIELVKEGEK